MVTKSRNFYCEIDKWADHVCTKELCFTKLAMTNGNSPSCLFSLLNGDMLNSHKICSYDYITNFADQFAITLSPSLTILRAKSNWLMTCPKGNPSEIKNCSLCTATIPCGCSLHTQTISLLASYSNCIVTDDHDVNVSFPFNFPILKHFYEETEYHINMSNQLLSMPLALELPASLDIATSFTDEAHELHKLHDKYIKHADDITPSQLLPEKLVSVINLSWIQYVAWGVLAAVAVANVIMWVDSRNKLQMALLAISKFDKTDAVPVLKSPNDMEYHIPYLEKLVLSFVVIMCIYFSIRSLIIIVKWWRNNQLSTWFRRHQVETTLMIMLDNQTDCVLLPISKFFKPPNMFRASGYQVREIEINFACTKGNLIIDWGKPSSILLINESHFTLPRMIHVPLPLYHRTCRLISTNEYVAKLVMRYNDAIFFIPETPIVVESNSG